MYFALGGVIQNSYKSIQNGLNATLWIWQIVLGVARVAHLRCISHLDTGPCDATPFAFWGRTIWRRHVFALMGQTKEDLRRLKSKRRGKNEQSLMQ